ncbi:MAG: ROK family transcriptional regulator [Clostridia bacterium]|nr:ROK family transcriptional regulator [Clostridia bacterium]
MPQRMAKVALPRDVKWNNRQMVLSVLRNGSAVTANEIHQRTGLSRPTVMKALQEYCEAGIVRSLGLGSTTSLGGKKPELFAFADTRKLFSISIWPESVALSVCGLTQEVTDIAKYPGDWHLPIDEVFCRVDALIDDYLALRDITRDEIYGVSLSVPGSIDYDTLTLMYNVKVPEWGVNINMRPRLEKLFPKAGLLFLDNAGKAVGRELLLHRDSTEARLVSVFTTWGISACMIEKGHVLNGRHSLIGEIGHMIIDSNASEQCICGKRGCLESMVSLPVIRRRLKADGFETDDDFTIRQLFDLSQKGSEPCRKVSAYLAHCFAVALHNLAVSYNQDFVVFQGDFAWADEVFITRLKDELCAFLYFPEDNPFTIEYDQRDLMTLAAIGDIQRLKNSYFESIE